MRLFVTSDSNYEARVDQGTNALDKTGYIEYLRKKDYGSSIADIGIVFMCRAPYLNFKQRIRFLKREKQLQMDIMLDYEQMSTAGKDERIRIVKEKFLEEVPRIIKKYRFNDFDLESFEKDLKRYFKKIVVT